MRRRIQRTTLLLWRRVRKAWEKLGSPPRQHVEPGRARPTIPTRSGDTPALKCAGFAEEALPWLDTVYPFALRLTRGDQDAADDLVQETFMNAYRSWHTFERGSNARSWLFTICRNAFLRGRHRSGAKREVPASPLGTSEEGLGIGPAFGDQPMDPEGAFFHEALDDEVVQAIDALPEEFREVLVLSDLGDLTYGEIARVLDVPNGTVKSRLFRARRLLQERLLEFARDAGYAKTGPTGAQENPMIRCEEALERLWEFLDGKRGRRDAQGPAGARATATRR